MRSRCHAPRHAGHPVRRGLSIQSLTSLEYWIARSSRATTALTRGDDVYFSTANVSPAWSIQPLDQLVLHRRARRPDAGRHVRRVAQQADRAFRDHLRGRAIAGIAVALDRRRGPGGRRARSRRTADRRGRSRALPSTAPRPASARRGRSSSLLAAITCLAIASPCSPGPVSTISS